MIIRSIRLNPFGGVSNKEISLEKGLNVIVGPNEAGKSTIYNGIQKALFTPSNLNKRTFDKEMKNHIPMGGGNTAKVEMQLLHNEKLYTLKKNWGGARRSELHLPDGSLISEENAVDEKLMSLLAAGPGTYKWILMSYQSGLAKTLDDLDNDSETLQSLGDIIRKTVLETDGVSVEKFKDEIEKLYLDHFEHWDHIQNYPENNKGIENPYKKGVGKVLAAFYKKESLRSALDKARSYEEELDIINKNLEACTLEIIEKDRYLKENEKAVNDARKRQTKCLDLKLKEAEIFQSSKDSTDWITSENEIIRLKESLKPAEAKLEELEKERIKAKVKAENQAIIQTLTRVEECKVKLDNAEEALKSTKRLEDTDLKIIRETLNKVDRLKASIEAGKLRARFAAKKAFKLTVQKDFEEEHTREVSVGEDFLLEAGGRLKLEHSEWKLEIYSGEEEVEKIIQSYEAAKQQRDNLLDKYGIQFLKEAEEINKNYNSVLNIANNAASNFEKELGNASYEELLRKTEKIGTESSSDETTRSLDEIVKEYVKLEGEINNIKKQLKIDVEIIQKLTSKYESKDKLLIKLGKASARKEELEKEISDLAPLPDGIEGEEAFIEKYDSTGKELKTHNDQKFELLHKHLNHEKEAPEQSAEELEKQLKEADDDSQIALRKAEAIARIRDLSRDLLAEIDSDTYEGLKKDLEKYISFITNGRHNYVEMDGRKGLPCGFVRNDGAVLKYELLSAGTKDVFSLALRLSMASYFLKEASGFVILDDPLVDMDPERQKKTGEIIRKFAENKQVIIFTCHPTHAEILGGNNILL
jgi:DNA repair protein SbcC/Rad50